MADKIKVNNFELGTELNDFGEYEIYGEDYQDPLAALREWVEKQRFIPQNLSTRFLQYFLNKTQDDVEKASEKFLKYFYLRQERSFIFKDRDPTNNINAKIFKNVYVLPIPGKTEDDKKVIVTGLLDGNQLNYHPMYHVKAIALILDLLLWNDELEDYIIVFNGKNFQSPYILTNVDCKYEKEIQAFQENFPFSLVGYYVLYPPEYVRNVMEMREGVWMTLCHSLQEIREKLPPDLLPLEFGGNLGHLEDLLEQWKVQLNKSSEFFIEFENQMANDYRRRLCHYKDLELGPFWTSRLKIFADEYEYKIQYYKNLQEPKTLKTIKPRQKKLRSKREDPLQNLRKLAKIEAEEAAIWTPPKFYNGYATEIQKSRQKTQNTCQILCITTNIPD